MPHIHISLQAGDNMVLKRMKRRHCREDVLRFVEEVFIKIIDAPTQFDSQKKFSTWVYSITTNSCLNILRNEKNRSRLLDENMQQPGDQVFVMHPNMDYHLLKQRINDVYAGLSEKEKNIFVLRFEHELPIKEIAEIISIPEGSVKSGIYYLLKKLSLHLKDFNHGK